MFSYLRSNNRRSVLSPAPNPSSPSKRHVHTSQGFPEDVPYSRNDTTSNRPNPSPISAQPPVLPPIPRVASRHDPDHKRVGPEDTSRSEDLNTVDHLRDEDNSFTPIERPTNRRFGNEHRPQSARSTFMGPPPVPLQQNLHSQNKILQQHQPVPDPIRSYSEPHFKLGKSTAKEEPDANIDPKLLRTPPQPAKEIPRPKTAATPSRQGKTKFNLLNPMALLARRRSQQAVAEANSEKAQYKQAFPPVPRIPDDFDPRIRGKVIHDFSAPRPGSNKASMRDESERQREAMLYGSRRPSPNPTTSSGDDNSPSSGERDHTPQFTEHFDDELNSLQDGPAKQGTSAFMYHVSLSNPQPDPHRSSLPPFARALPSKIVSVPSNRHDDNSPPINGPLEKVPESQITDAVPLHKPNSSTPPRSPPVQARSRASSNTESPYQPAILPKRFKSNASRFSFDMTGVGSATQEQILEDKHRQHEQKKARRSGVSQLSTVGNGGRDLGDEDEDFDEYDDVDDDNGLEEKIPGINADEDEPKMLYPQDQVQGSDHASPHQSSFTSDPSLASTGVTSPNTPRDSMGRAIHFDTTQAPNLAPYNYCSSELLYHAGLDPKAPTDGFIDTAHSHPTVDLDGRKDVPKPLDQPDEDDDMYFDDGMIDDLDEQAEPFDESVFDDETSRIYGLPLRDQKLSPEGPGVAKGPSDPLTSGVNTASDLTSTYNASSYTGHTFGHSRTEVVEPFDKAPTSLGVPTGDSSSSAYHDALVAGVNRAAMDGKFARAAALPPHAEDDSSYIHEVPQADGPADSVALPRSGGWLVGAGSEDTEGFDFDDDLADDTIIAAANAEALENDDDGFYGQEFGFFARASASGEAEYANGGYFGSRAFEGIGRSHSGRANEPSLTPITERSEFSNRNSAISLTMHGFQPHSAGAQSSSGLTQLADLMHMQEDDMSLSVLMKLRRGAWGGSAASLVSSSSGSPMNYVPGAGFPAAVPMQHSNSSNGNFVNGSPLTMHSGHHFASSSYSLNSSNGIASSHEDSSPSPASATITLATQQQTLPVQPPPQNVPPFFSQHQLQQTIPLLSQPTASHSNHPHRRSMSPVKRSSMGPPSKPLKGHSRNSSAASESVSYVLEGGGEDGGQGHWVLEKRRTDESGVVEVLGREVVEGGRI
ncbi:MAG: hypothetical protein Q9174_004447 [Haloplaca sp. 1 TL-2023]